MESINISSGGWIDDDETVTVKKYSHMLEVTNSSNKQTNLKKYKRHDKNTYVNTVTGELIEYKQNDMKILKWVKREVANAKDILINNFYGHQNVLFITLTYNKPVIDFKEVQRNFRNFYNKLQRRYGKLIYFQVVELQKNRWQKKKQKSLHIHLALKNPNVKRFSIENDEICVLWEKGFTKTDRLETVNKIASYFFKDFLYQENLRLYPKYKNIFQCSQGLKDVTTETYTMKEFLNKYGEAFYRENSNIINIIDNKTGKIMCIHKKQNYMPRKYKKKNKSNYKCIIPIRFIKVENDKIVCDDIYTFRRRYLKRYGIKIPINTKNTVLMDKIRKMQKRKKQWILLKATFPLKYDLSNTTVIDILDEKDIVVNRLF